MPGLAPKVLHALATVWPNPLAKRNARFGAPPNSDDYHRAYARDQFMRRVRYGLGASHLTPELWNKDVLEIGCGHGGVTCYLASVGARSVTGIDLNEHNMQFGRELAEFIGAQLERKLPIEFRVMDAHDLEFEPESFDLVLADNVFEHVHDPARVLSQIFRVLRPGGGLLVPIFSAIRSKYGLHLKQGLKVPWANLVFSEETIVEALKMQAERRPELYHVYPGLHDNPRRVRDVRRHKDLNDISYESFVRMAEAVGFTIEKFEIKSTNIFGRALFKTMPNLGRTVIGDVLSTGASAYLSKPSVRNA